MRLWGLSRTGPGVGAGFGLPEQVDLFFGGRGVNNKQNQKRGEGGEGGLAESGGGATKGHSEGGCDARASVSRPPSSGPRCRGSEAVHQRCASMRRRAVEPARRGAEVALRRRDDRASQQDLKRLGKSLGVAEPRFFGDFPDAGSDVREMVDSCPTGGVLRSHLEQCVDEGAGLEVVVVEPLVEDVEVGEELLLRRGGAAAPPPRRTLGSNAVRGGPRRRSRGRPSRGSAGRASPWRRRPAG